VDAFAIIIVIILSLWSITKTLEKLTNKVLDKQNKHSELLEEIKSKLEGKSDN
jgi:ABC-type nickel/cobalt efflux system permease component RcnA